MELLKQFGLIGSGNARPGVSNGDVESAVRHRDLDGNLPSIGEFDRVTDQIEQDLGQTPLVAATSRQVRGYLSGEFEFLVGRQRLNRTVNRVGNVLQGVISEVEHELTGLDLGQIEHIIDQPEQVLAVALQPLQYSHHSFRWLAIGAIGHQLGVAENGVERGA